MAVDGTDEPHMMFANAAAAPESFAYMESYVQKRLADGLTPSQVLALFNVRDSFSKEFVNGTQGGACEAGGLSEAGKLSELLVRWVSHVQDVSLSRELVRAAISGDVDQVGDPIDCSTAVDRRRSATS